MDTRVLRLIDANLNRASEGLRVVEDCLRFYWNDADHSAAAKSLRHRLFDSFRFLPNAARLQARDTSGDVGTTVTAEGEYQREGIVELLQANLERAKQSLRVLEETSKTMEPDDRTGQLVSHTVEQLRYELYTLEKSLVRYLNTRCDWEDRRLYVLIDGCGDEASFQSCVDELIGADVDLIQLRDKQLCDRDLLERAKQLVKSTRGTRTLAIMNDRPDIACAAKADGVHVGQEELRVSDCRRIMSPYALVGVSTHSADQIQEAIAEGADYLGVGPVFPSRTKQFDVTVGLDLIREATRIATVPWFAIGGIDDATLTTVLEAGARRVAVAGAIQHAEDRLSAARALRHRLLEMAALDRTTNALRHVH